MEYAGGPVQAGVARRVGLGVGLSSADVEDLGRHGACAAERGRLRAGRARERERTRYLEDAGVDAVLLRYAEASR
jgi:hypothetical protein